MEKKSENTNITFRVTLNDKIIIERIFTLSKYNPQAKYSLEWTEYMNYLASWMERRLINESSDFMCERSYGIEKNPDFFKTNKVDEFFDKYVKHKDTVIGHRRIDAQNFPPAIRYSLDIRPYMRDIKEELFDLLSKQKEFTFEYLGYDLLVN